MLDSKYPQKSQAETYKYQNWDYLTNKGETKKAIRKNIYVNGKYIDKDCQQSANKITGKPYPLYFDKIPEDFDDPIVIVEGEKCVDWFTKNTRIFATTNIGGSQAVHKTDWTPLAERDVVLWPDNDKPGRKWEQELGQVLIDLGCSVSVVQIPDGMPDKWDCYNLPKKDLIDYFSKAKPFKQKRIIDQPKHLKVIEGKGGVDLGMTFKASDYVKTKLPPKPTQTGNTTIITDGEQFDRFKRLPNAHMRSGGDWMACCPGHEDKTPSMQFWYKDGKFGAKCYAGCDFDSILAAAKVKNEPTPYTGTRKFNPKIKEIKGDVEFRSYADIQPKAVDWLVDDWIALGELCILAGRPGQGKTTLATKLASIVSSGGGQWGDGSKVIGGQVVLYASETSIEKKNVPNVYANSGNPSNIIEPILAPNPEAEKGNEEGIEFDPSIHIPFLTKTLKKHPDVKLIIFDPVVDVIMNVRDEHRANEIRKALKPLQILAKERNVAILGITHFLKRHNSKGSSVMDLVHGSGAWMRIAQQGWAVEESEELGKFLMKFKNNIGNDEGGFRYSLERKEIKFEEEAPITGIEVLFGDHIQGTADEIMATTDKEDPDKKSQVETGIDFLTQYFADLTNKDYRKWEDITLEAKTNLGISKPTLDRAKARLKGFLKSA